MLPSIGGIIMKFRETLKTMHERITSPFYTGVAIINKDRNKILLAKRREDGIWTNPGGHPEKGESPRQAAIREVKEETNIDITINDLNPMFLQTASDGKPVHVYYTIIDEFKQNISTKNDPDNEVPNWKWFEFDKLPKGVMKDEERFITMLNAIIEVLKGE